MPFGRIQSISPNGSWLPPQPHRPPLQRVRRREAEFRCQAAFRVSRERQGPAEGFCYGQRDRQAKAMRAPLAGRAVARADAVEGLAEKLNDPGVDDRAGVADADPYPSLSRVGAGPDLHGPAAGVVADRVGEQVAHRLAQQRKVRDRPPLAGNPAPAAIRGRRQPWWPTWGTGGIRMLTALRWRGGAVGYASLARWPDAVAAASRIG